MPKDKTPKKRPKKRNTITSKGRRATSPKGTPRKNTAVARGRSLRASRQARKKT